MKPEPDPSRTVAIILAAGLGTRMKSQRPKVLHELCGRPMLGYVVEAATTATGSRPLVVYSPPTVAVTEAFADAADFALQDEPRGTADALLAALRVLPPDAARVLVVYGDVPLLEAGLLGLLLEAQQASSAATEHPVSSPRCKRGATCCGGSTRSVRTFHAERPWG